MSERVSAYASANGKPGAMPQDLRSVVQVILEGYTLPLEGFHGVTHWARVLEIHAAGRGTATTS